VKFNIEGRDIIALVLLIGAFVLKALGYDGFIDTLILGVALAYGAFAIPRPPSTAKKKQTEEVSIGKNRSNASQGNN